MVFKKKKKAPSRRAPFLVPSVEQTKHFAWCIQNGIGVCVVPNWKTSDKWNVEIILRDKSNVNPIDYEGIEALTKMYEYCKYYYDKNKKDEK
jgi:hypothetical protein